MLKKIEKVLTKLLIFGYNMKCNRFQSEQRGNFGGFLIDY